MVSLKLGYEKFDGVIIIGFLFIILGNIIYAEVLIIPRVTNRMKGTFLKRSFLVSDNDEDENTYWPEFDDETY